MGFGVSFPRLQRLSVAQPISPVHHNGIVHVEAPATVHPTLGDFLDIWGKTYPDDQLLVQARDAIAAGEVTVDDKPYTSDATALVLADKMRIFLGS